MVAASAVITVGFDPSNAFDPGWQLSIAASWMLAAVPRAADDAKSRPSLSWSLVTAWSEALLTSLRVGVAVTPILAWQFQRVALTALAANAVAAPVAEAAALPLVLAAGLVGNLLGRTGHVIGYVLDPVLAALFAAPHWALSLPLATMSLPPPTPRRSVLRCGHRHRRRAARVARPNLLHRCRGRDRGRFGVAAHSSCASGRRAASHSDRRGAGGCDLRRSAPDGSAMLASMPRAGR